MSKTHEKTKPKLKQSSNISEKIQKENNINHKNKMQISQEEERTKKSCISIKDQNAKDKFEYENFKEKSKLLSDYYAPNITLKNLNITLRCLSCYKIPKIRFNYPNFKVFISCPKHRKSLSYQEFLEKGYNNDLINMPCCRCKKKHNYMVRGSFYICLQCNQIFCPECSTKKEKCQAYYNNNANNKKEKKNIYINNNEEQQSKIHILIKLDIYDNKCHLHQVNQFSLYCLDCQCELCSRCQETHTKGHKIRSLTKYTVNNKFIEVCLSRVKNEKDNIELVEKYINCFNNNNEEEENMKKNLLFYISQDKYALDIKECILKSYKEKKFIYNAIRNVRKLKFPWLSSINPLELDKIKNKKEIYKHLNIYLIEGNLNDEQSISNDNNSQDDSDSSDDNLSFFSLSQNVNKNNDDFSSKEKINICFNNNIDKEDLKSPLPNISKKTKKKEEKTGKTEKEKKNLENMKHFLCEQDEITIECLLGLKNSNFILGLLSGDINIYKNDSLKKNYTRILKISEHKSGINSLFELPNNSILTASSDRLLKKINLLNNSTSYKVEYIFNLHTSSVYKGIKLKTSFILSCGINDYLILWINNNPKEDLSNDNINTNHTDNNDSNKYKTIKFVDGGQGISDIIETRAGNFVSSSDFLQFWTFFPEKTYNNINENSNIHNIINNKNKIINDSVDSQISKCLNHRNKSLTNTNLNSTYNNTSNRIESSEIYFNVTYPKKFKNEKESDTKLKKIYINDKEYYERTGTLDIKTSGSNCLCRLNSRYLFVNLSEEQKGKIAIIDADKIECVNIIEISKYELTCVSNFNEDSIVVSCTEFIDESYVVLIKQYQISRINGLTFVGQKTKYMSEYYIKRKDKIDKNNEKNGGGIDNKKNYDFSKRIKEQINCITYTNNGLLICSGKIESPEKSSLVGEIDLFI